MKKNRAVLCLVLVLLSSSVKAECVDKYDRSLYPHWGKSPVAGYKDVRQFIISTQIVSGLKVSKGKVVEGIFYDPYTGRLYDIRSFTPHVDHIWALKYIHLHGGACATPKQRREIANDPLNLIAVHPSSNIKRSFKVAEWLPINGGYWPEYLRRLKALPLKYQWLIISSEARRKFKAVKAKAHEVRNGFFIEKQKWWFKRFFSN